MNGDAAAGERAAPSPLAARLVPYGFARSGQILVAHQHADSLKVWISERTSEAALAEIARNYGVVSVVRVPADDLAQAINQAYARQDGSAAQVVGEVEGEVDLSRLMQDIPEVEDLLESEDDAPIIRMINALLTQAAREQASDIHIEPFENASVVRFRVDGTLRDVVRPKKALHGALISRIKIMAQLDIAEKRLPQDGRITLRVGGRPVDVRVSTLPTGHAYIEGYHNGQNQIDLRQDVGNRPARRCVPETDRTDHCCGRQRVHEPAELLALVPRGRPDHVHQLCPQSDLVQSICQLRRHMERPVDPGLKLQGAIGTPRRNLGRRLRLGEVLYDKCEPLRYADLIQIGNKRRPICDAQAGWVLNDNVDDFHCVPYRLSPSRPPASSRPPSSASYPSREDSCSSDTALSPPPDRSERPRRVRNETATLRRVGESATSSMRAGVRRVTRQPRLRRAGSVTISCSPERKRRSRATRRSICVAWCVMAASVAAPALRRSAWNTFGILSISASKKEKARCPLGNTSR
ncbi:GspE/PulE family protein [Paraburkholderia youngii]|uniref:GspE/PulE family protein n=1 Tax=Paraburkholderia youngii TaxID=2782701 RepID=UPI003D198E17